MSRQYCKYYEAGAPIDEETSPMVDYPESLREFTAHLLTFVGYDQTETKELCDLAAEGDEESKKEIISRLEHMLSITKLLSAANDLEDSDKKDC